MATTLDKYISRGKSGSSAGGLTTLDKHLGKNSSSKLEEARKRLAEQDKIYKKNQAIKSSQENTQKYVDEYTASQSGIIGGINRFLGRGVAPPVFTSDSPEVIAQKSAPQPTLGQNVRELLTGNTQKTAYDVIYQDKLDKVTLENIKSNNNAIKVLSDKNKTEKDSLRKTQRDKSIQFLLDSNKKLAESAGSELKNKTTLQLAGQSLGTALELTPFLGAGSLGVRAGEKAIEVGAKVVGKTIAKKVATKSLTKEAAKEAGVFGAATGLSGGLQQENPTLKSIAIETAKGGIFGGIFGGILGFIGTKLGSKLPKLEKAIQDETLTPKQVEELLAKGGVKEVEKALDAPTVTIKEEPLDATSVASYIDTNSGVKVITPLSKRELEILADEVRMIPTATKGVSQIHLDAKTPVLEDAVKSGEAIQVSRSDFLAGHPQAQDVFDNMAKDIEKIKETISSESTQSKPSQSKPSGFAKSLEAKALERDMGTEFDGVAEYSPASRKEQAELAAKVVNGDREMLNKILDGVEALPGGLRGSSLALAVEKVAIKNNDYKLIQKLAQSKFSTSISEAGSELSMLVGRNADSPVRIIRDITKARETSAAKRMKVKNVSQVRKSVKREVKDAIAKSAPTKESWKEFIKQIEC